MFDLNNLGSTDLDRKKMGLLKSIGYLIVVVILTPKNSLAQTPTQAPSQTYQSYFDLGVKTGSFLPYEIEGVTEVLPFWGIKLGHTVSPTLGIEYDIDIAHAKGVTYLLGYASLRHDFVVGKVLPLFLLIGLDAHYFKKKDDFVPDTFDPANSVVVDHPWKFFGGWHVGIGSETVIYGDLWIRADVRMGFSPGRQLSVSLTGIYRF